MDMAVKGLKFLEKGSTMLKYTLAATVLAIGFASTAFAGPLDDVIKARQACMKANGASMATYVPIVKGEKPYDAAAVKTATDAIDAACGGWAGWWAPETQKGETVETFAKAEVWSDAAGFKAAETAYGAAIAKLKASTDDATFKVAFGEFGGSCKGCHEKFRRAKE
jgi:cytochrome c556